MQKRFSSLQTNGLFIGLACCSLGLLLLAQTSFQHQHISVLVAAAALIGIVGWSWCVWQQPPLPDVLGVLQPSALDARFARGGLAVSALILAIASWLSIKGNAFNRFAVVTWVLAVGLWLLAWVPWQRPTPVSIDADERRRRRLAALLLLGITIIGCWLRFHRLSTTPNDMTQDHAWKLLDIQTILDGGRPIFFPNNTGREPGQFYYIAMLIKLFDLPRDFMALKIGNGIIGTITIPMIYLFGREVGGRKLGLFAAFLYAVGKWPIAITRMGLRYPYAMLPAALVLWSLWRYVRYGKRSDALLVGVWMGLGLYGYIAIRIVPLVIVAVFVLLLVFDRRRRSKQQFGTLIAHGTLLLVTTALIFLPLGHFMLERPDLFWYRVNTRAGDTERSVQQTFCADGILGSSPEQPLDSTVCKIGIFLRNNVDMALAFNWRGNISQVDTVSLDPFLDVVSAALLLACLPIIAWRLFKQRSLRWWMLIISLPILLLTSTLNVAFPIENPTTPRTGVATPVVFVLAAVPLVLLTEWLIGRKPWSHIQRPMLARWAVLAGLLIGLLGTATQQNYHTYFVIFDAQYRAFVPNTGEIAAAVESYRDRGITPDRTYLLGWPYWLDARAVGVHLGDVLWNNTHVINTDQPLLLPTDGKPLLYILNKDDEARRNELVQQFPAGELQRIKTELPQKTFYVFYVPGRT